MGVCNDGLQADARGGGSNGLLARDRQRKVENGRRAGQWAGK